ncbi:hypothetical protein EAE99_006661 [Botrytis elliptica]|nr:hypothetical protein EAE99_006661 [Botrytis elliptica]
MDLELEFPIPTFHIFEPAMDRSCYDFHVTQTQSLHTSCETNVPEFCARNFATLDIILPSTRAEEKIVIKSENVCIHELTGPEPSNWDSSFFCWFSDLSITSTTPISGHRLALRYSLRYTSIKDITSLPAHAKPSINLRSTLRQWTDNTSVANNILTHVLKKDYGNRCSDKDLRWDDLFAITQLRCFKTRWSFLMPG